MMKSKLRILATLSRVAVLCSLFGTHSLLACDVPTGIISSAITTSSASVYWNPVASATGYVMKYSIKNSALWIDKMVTTNSELLTGLQPGTIYEVIVQSTCPVDSSEFSPVHTFATIVPTPDHIVICIMENKDYDDIIDSSAAPFINSLVNDTCTALFTQYFAIEHPSFPNYLDLYSGSNQGITQDTCISVLFTTPNLGSQLLTAGKTYATYCEDLPYAGYTGCATGNYVKKHNAAVNWIGTGMNQIPPDTDLPFTDFSSLTDYSSLPTVSFVIPNKINDMHDGTIEAGDVWIQDNLGNYIEWAKTNNSLFILTFDESDESPTNQIPTLFTGAMIRSGQYSEAINHYNMLHTLEDMYALPYAGNAANSTAITGCWKDISIATGFENESENDLPVLHIFPNPVIKEATILISECGSQPLSLGLYNLFERHVYEFTIDNTASSKGKDYSFDFSVAKLGLSPGLYFLQLNSGAKWACKKFIIQ